MTVLVFQKLWFNFSMSKDFKAWHDKKADIDEIVKRLFFHEREIWYCHLGLNIGFEQDGRGEDFLRPIIVLRKFNKEVLWIVPLTHTKKNSRYYYSFNFVGATSTAILSQLKLIDSRRLSYKIGEIDSESFLSLKQKLKVILP